MNATSTAEVALPGRASATLALCFCAAIIEGLDIQSMGIAAPGIGPEFHLSKQALGQVLTASPLGLFIGAFIGGRCADVWGRKRALVMSMAVFGAFQLATAWASGYESLLALRMLCGLGLGGAFPNLIALTAESSGGRNNILNVVITAAGMPTGGALASTIGFFAGPAGDWRLVFYVGGLAPLILAPIMAVALPESNLFRQALRTDSESARPGVLDTLFHPSRARQTILLWIAFFTTTLVVHLLLNWLPNLMLARGFTRPEAFFIQILFNIGAAVGSVALGWRMQRRPSGTLLLACYGLLSASLLVLASLHHELATVAGVVAVIGATVLGAQFILYGLSPAYYRTAGRGTGTGAAVAASRLGSASGPFWAGLLLGAGASATQVLQSLLPITAAAATAAVLLMLLPRAHHLPD